MDKHKQLKERKFRKGAVHSRKKIFTADKSEEHERHCNICYKNSWLKIDLFGFVIYVEKRKNINLVMI